MSLISCIVKLYSAIHSFRSEVLGYKVMATTDMELGSSDNKSEQGPSDPESKYPLKVLYCGVCSLPTEYCEYMPEPAKCRQWLEKTFQIAKKKYVTRVCGLGTFDIDLKEAQRFFAQKFSCGASVTAEDEIIIQGDFTDDIIDVIQEKWPEVDDDSIDDLGEVKK
ncbi:hypothetical protein WMY93_020822 [Mugilogobius chulae]|uniref:Density-regulated protein n=1 Tax=Mugilogobius chulae TaxID=88201 RepID=A0AAW0NDU8_9GOBI